MKLLLVMLHDLFYGIGSISAQSEPIKVHFTRLSHFVDKRAIFTDSSTPKWARKVTS